MGSWYQSLLASGKMHGEAGRLRIMEQLKEGVCRSGEGRSEEADAGRVGHCVLAPGSVLPGKGVLFS